MGVTFGKTMNVHSYVGGVFVVAHSHENKYKNSTRNNKTITFLVIRNNSSTKEAENNEDNNNNNNRYSQNIHTTKQNFALKGVGVNRYWRVE